MELIFPILTGVLMLATGLPLYLYANETARFSKPARLVIKSAITFFGGTLALAGALRSGFAFAYLAAAGLLVCAAADTLLEIKFFVGGSFFAAGHILYIASFLTRTRPGALSVPAFAPAPYCCAACLQNAPAEQSQIFRPRLRRGHSHHDRLCPSACLLRAAHGFIAAIGGALSLSRLDTGAQHPLRRLPRLPRGRHAHLLPRPIPACAVGLPCLPVGLKPRLRTRQPAFGGLSMYPIFPILSKPPL